ncbi:MAG: TIGR04282 family arsenosugar biosynthesis glycosyltransferase [Candidatus Sericytochromatia bacterium]
MNKLDCVAIFIKYPEEGNVKSRLAKDIGNKNAKNLYIKFVEDIITKLKNMSFDIQIYYSPEDKEKDIKNWLGNNLNYNVQVGKDLGEKMTNAFIESFSQYTNVIIIGSDSPDLSIDILNTGFQNLKNRKSIIGKSRDGGYYLIGFNKNKFLPDIFKDIKWSTETVFDDTMIIFKNNHYNVYSLDEWYDVDNLEDLKYMYYSNVNTEFNKSKTFNFIKENINF